MLKTGSDIYLRLPDSGTDRILHPAVVIATTDSDASQVAITDPDLEISNDLDIILFRHIKGEFMQQPARVTAIEGNIATIVTTGDPVSAESRQVYRVTAISADADVRVDDREVFSLQDVSGTGFAFIAPSTYQIGQQLSVVVRCEKTEVAGTACVQSIRELGKNRTRYGLRSVGSDQDDFTVGLNQVSLTVQRSQLARR
ncbi:MAG: hypothetical protein ACI8W3_001574 [Myxococcota bacterium]|jgi:hypothetical protein